MASITVRRLGDHLKARLRVRAAEHGRSMEEEARLILAQALEPASGASGQSLFDAIHGRFARIGGMDIELPAREPMREPPAFRGPEWEAPESSEAEAPVKRPHKAS